MTFVFPQDERFNIKVREQLLHGLCDIEVDDAIIYAVLMTDRVATDENWDLLTAAEQREWNGFVDEFLDEEAEGASPCDLFYHAYMLPTPTW